MISFLVSSFAAVVVEYKYVVFISLSSLLLSSVMAWSMGTLLPMAWQWHKKMR
ncbi:MAG TPA: hypothetical protein PLW44_14950 [Chitinophagales bacterium]|nr:hypothetical protein [Chitinophagales bacterium]